MTVNHDVTGSSPVGRVQLLIRGVELAVSKNIIKRALYSFAYGDILGVPMEFSNEYNKICVDRYVEPKHFKQPTGVWSDDTALMLATMDSLSQQNRIDFTDLMNRYYHYTRGHYTSTGTTFDIGLGTRQAIMKYKLGYHPLNAGGKHKRNNGNGSIMRLLPIVFIPEVLDESDIITRYTIIKNYTQVTHRHYTSIIGTFIYIELLREMLLRDNETLNIPEILEYIKSEITQITALTTEKESKKIVKAQNKYSDLFDGSVEVKTYKGSGYILDTLCFAIQAILTHDNFKSAVVYAANTANDNDTVAAITGAIGSLYYQYDNYNPPLDWSYDIYNKQLLEDYINIFISKL